MEMEEAILYQLSIYIYINQIHCGRYDVHNFHLSYKNHTDTF